MTEQQQTMDIRPSRTTVTSFSSDENAMSYDSNGEFDNGVYILQLASSSSSSSSSVAAPGASSPVISCALSNQCISIYESSSLRQVRDLGKCHDGTIHDICHFGTNGEFLASCGGDGFVKIFDLRSSSTAPSLSFKTPKRDEEALSVAVGYD
eukprot:15353010-Ditylum_brightwellii.AAC.1